MWSVNRNVKRGNIAYRIPPPNGTFLDKASVLQSELTGVGWYPVKIQDFHYSDVIMSTMTSKITSLTMIYSTVYSGRSKKI